MWPLLLVLLAPGLFLVPLSRAEAGPAVQENRPRLRLEDWPLDEQETDGRRVYENYCIGCHGQEGRGDGDAAAALSPRPRNFQSGKFKFRSTPSGKLPKVPDLVRTITCGLPGSAMPGFPLVPEHERRHVARYVQALSLLREARIEVQELIERGRDYDAIVKDDIARIKTELVLKRITKVPTIPVPPVAPPKPEMLAKGKELFVSLCAKCHGESGQGDGPSSYTQRDWKDEAVPVRNFAAGVFRAGSQPRDIFLRIRTGLDGTSMGATGYGTDEEIWGVVHYVLGLVDPEAKKPRMVAGCGSREDNQ